MKTNLSQIYMMEKTLCNYCDQPVGFCLHALSRDVVEIHSDGTVIKCKSFISKLYEFNQVILMEDIPQ